VKRKYALSLPGMAPGSPRLPSHCISRVGCSRIPEGSLLGGLIHAGPQVTLSMKLYLRSDETRSFKFWFTKTLRLLAVVLWFKTVRIHRSVPSVGCLPQRFNSFVQKVLERVPFEQASYSIAAEESRFHYCGFFFSHP
jgi:hypothetical protein